MVFMILSTASQKQPLILTERREIIPNFGKPQNSFKPDKPNSLVMKILLILFIKIFFVLVMTAQWEPMNGPFGGSINDLNQNNQFQFAATTNGIYRSSNEGRSWNHLTLKEGNNFACLQIGIYNNVILADVVDFVDNSVIRYLFQSQDNGESWRQVNRPDVDWYFNIALNDTHWYLLDLDDLWLSIDQGKNWSHSVLDTTINRINNLKNFDDKIYVVIKNKLYKSNGSFDGFDEITPSSDETIGSIIAFDSLILVKGKGDKLFRSFDYGKTWESKFTGVTDMNNFCKQGLALYCNDYETIYKSIDNGLTWKDQHTKYFSSLAHIMIATDSSLLTGALYAGIKSSRDGGITFHESNFGISACFVQSLALRNGKLFTGSVYLGITGFDIPHAAWDTSYSLSISAEVTDIAFVGQNVMAIAGHQLFKSTNNGLNWTETTPFGITSMPFTFFPFNELIIAGGTPGGYMIFTNKDGTNWNQYSINVNGQQVTSTYLFAKNDHTLFVAKRKLLFRSDDQGFSWDTSMNGLILENQFSFIDKLYAFNDTLAALVLDDASPIYTLYISYDNGITWDPFQEGIPKHIDNSGIRSLTKVDQILLASMYNYTEGVYVSFNHGQSWQSFNEGLDAGGIIEIISDNEYLYAATSGQGVWRRKIADLYTVSTSQIQPDKALNIYPNPSSGNIIVSIDSFLSYKARIVITDIQGALIELMDIYFEGQMQVLTEKIPPGIYILSLQTDRQVYSGKFIIAR